MLFVRPLLASAVLCVLLTAGCASSRHAPADHPRLAELYTQDQADRTADTPDWFGIARRDAERRAEVQRLLDAGAARTAADYYHAAMIFQHGTDSVAYRKARDLARTAEQLGSAAARWLAAAAHDRYLLSTGAAQHYGTQFIELPNGRWHLSPFDSTAVTDTERARVGARTLAEIRAFLDERNGTPALTLDPPPTPEPHRAPTVELIGGIDGLVAQIMYPEAARAARIEGVVVVELVVGADGTVGEAAVAEGPGHGLDEEALRLVRQARFVNHTGAPREIRLRIPFAL